VHQIAPLKPDALIVLGLLVESDVLKLLLEIQSISHLVEEESQKEISPAALETRPPVFFVLSGGLVKLIAFRKDVRHRTSYNSSCVQIHVEPVLVLVLGHKRLVILEIGEVVDHKDPGVDALIGEVVPLVELQTHEEGVHVVVLVGLREWLGQTLVALIRTRLAQLGVQLGRSDLV
jgi:hypothetical protein